MGDIESSFEVGTGMKDFLIFGLNNLFGVSLF